MSCFSCCEEGDIHKAANNGLFMPHNSASNSGGYYAKETAPKETKTITIQPIAVSDISVDELKDIIDNIGTKALIGEGSYGRVYYGVLKSGPTAAIKKLDSSKRREQEFLVQISMVSRLKHENVVELVGYCVGGPLQVLACENDLNGSLHDILHGTTNVVARLFGAMTAQGKPMIDFLEQNIFVIGVGSCWKLMISFEDSLERRLIVMMLLYKIMKVM
ncbi:hypothetical protein FNV43_RR22552 [Rhamnella rubrinervis]|uniref:Protein kinase domain-containing protein n=1 Tax=Rhamnella rubrinervis TaxID=2594499 RepID=A0A8K0GSL8_9ROSA|nr:hypothetical protein FNV43_RR22552 [Rhamnella rubrinervis]